MTLKLTCLATVASLAFANAAQAQTTTTTETAPPATQTTHSTTTQTTTQAPPTTDTVPAGTDTQPATTTETTTQTQTTTTQPAAGAVALATQADIKSGVEVYDQSGALVGKVDSVDSDGAVVNTGKARAKIPLSSFGKNDKGLVVSLTKADLDAQAKAETKSTTKAEKKPKG